MLSQLFTLVLTTALCASGASAATWNSQLFPKIDGKFTIRTIDFAGREWTLDDFSYVGYRLGMESPGSVPCGTLVRITGRAENSAALAGAIHRVGWGGGG